MAKWGVTFHVDATAYVVVEADSKEEAEEKAWDEIDADEAELGDPINIVHSEQIQDK